MSLPTPWLSFVCALALAAAGCGKDSTGTGNGNGGDGGPVGDGGAGDAVVITDGGGPECTDNNDCNGGFCVDGSCCPTAPQVCGNACCTGQEVCFANACVVPQGDCRSTRDCQTGQYCEPGLGDPDGGVPPDPNCLASAPTPGKCVDLPPRCDQGGDPDTCINDCEYHPPVQTLSAVQKWSWGPVATEYPNFTDVWATPAVARMHDTNCDGVVDEFDPSTVVFVSGDAQGSYCSNAGVQAGMCQTGVLRALDGLTGQELWSLRAADPTSGGFAGLSVAMGDIDNDGWVEVVAATGEGYVAVVDASGIVEAVSDLPIPGSSANSFGWGGALAIGDMDGDGSPEIAYGRTVYDTTGGLVTLRFTGTGGQGGSNINRAISLFADLDGDFEQELVAGRTAYQADGTPLWDNTGIPDGFPAIGDFDNNGLPEIALQASGNLYVLNGADGSILLGPLAVPGGGNGGPPTVADFDGDGFPEIGVAMQNFYSVLKPNFTTTSIDVVWSTPNHDLSSSVTGSTVFDFEGDGIAEVIYNDECFLWVYDGPTGQVRFATPTLSFTATEASIVADVDGDGHAEILIIANGADPSSSGWGCDVAPWNQPDPVTGRPAWAPPPGSTVYRGISLWGDTANSWVGTRTIWNQHTYHVTNICDFRDDACAPPNLYGQIPAYERDNWGVPWLNNYRQNAQDQGIFDAPDGTVELAVDCTDPLLMHAYVRNIGAAILPAGVEIGYYVRQGGNGVLLGTEFTTDPIFPGQIVDVTFSPTPGAAATDDTFYAEIVIDPLNPTFHECREDNNVSPDTVPNCLIVD